MRSSAARPSCAIAMARRMLELQALAPEDGWALVKQADRILLVRPPYRREQLVEVGADAVARAVGLHGFEAVFRPFADWSALIEHLRAEVVRAHEGRPRIEDPARRLLRHAPRPVIEQYLDRIAIELLPDGELGPAAELLESLLALDLVTNSADLRDRAVALLGRCGARPLPQSLVDRLATFDRLTRS